MPAILIVTLTAEQKHAEASLVRQLCRWKLEGGAELAFLARTAASDDAPQTTRLCAEFRDLAEAGAFVSEFRRGSGRPEPVRMFEILQSESVPEIEALSAAV